MGWGDLNSQYISTITFRSAPRTPLPPKACPRGPRATGKQRELLHAEFQILSRISLGGTRLTPLHQLWGSSPGFPSTLGSSSGAGLNILQTPPSERPRLPPPRARGSPLRGARMPAAPAGGAPPSGAREFSRTPARVSSPPPPHSLATWLPVSGSHPAPSEAAQDPPGRPGDAAVVPVS